VARSSISMLAGVIALVIATGSTSAATAPHADSSGAGGTGPATVPPTAARPQRSDVASTQQPISLATTTATLTTTNYGETSRQITYRGTWYVASSTKYLGGHIKWARVRGASASFTFTGTGVSWIGPIGPTRGQANVYLNGRFLRSVNLHATTYSARHTILSLNFATQATRTLKVIVIGTVGHPNVGIDAFSVRHLVTSTTPPPPTPTPGKTIVATAGTPGLVIKTSGTVLDGYTITGPQATTFNGNEIGIYVTGTPTAPLHDIVIRNCYIGRFGSGGIVLQYVQSFTIENCTIEDSVYAGIRVISGSDGVIRYNTIRRTGVVGYQANDMNAYGIALTDFGGAVTTRVQVLSNTVEDVPQWHGIDTHGGTFITISDNIVRRTNRAIFVTTSSNGRRASDIRVDRNALSQPTPRVDMASTYPYNENGITVYAADRVAGTANAFDGWPLGNTLDILGGSTSVSFTSSVITNVR
jgi:parallel beta-helix repeat protein